MMTQTTAAGFTPATHMLQALALVATMLHLPAEPAEAKPEEPDETGSDEDHGNAGGGAGEEQDEPENLVRVWMQGGLVQAVQVPTGVNVRVIDMDIEGSHSAVAITGGDIPDWKSAGSKVEACVENWTGGADAH